MWMALRERVCAIDEINMATMRMRLRLPNELPADPPEANIVEPAEVKSIFSVVLKRRQISVSILINAIVKCVYMCIHHHDFSHKLGCPTIGRRHTTCSFAL